MSQPFAVENVSSTGPSRHAVDLDVLLAGPSGPSYEPPSVTTYSLDGVEVGDLLTMSGNN